MKREGVEQAKMSQIGDGEWDGAMTSLAGGITLGELPARQGQRRILMVQRLGCRDGIGARTLRLRQDACNARHCRAFPLGKSNT